MFSSDGSCLNNISSAMNKSNTKFDFGIDPRTEQDFNKVIDLWRVYSNYEDVQEYLGADKTIHTLVLKGDKNYDVD